MFNVFNHNSNTTRATIITPQKSSCPNHSTPPTIATNFADFVLDKPPEDLVDEEAVAVSEDEATPGEMEDATAPRDVEVEDPPEDAEDECRTDAEAPAASSVLRKKKTANQQPNKRTIRREGPTYK